MSARRTLACADHAATVCRKLLSGSVVAKRRLIPDSAEVLSEAAGKVKRKCFVDVPRVVSSAKPQWVRMSDPMRNEIHLRNESRAALRWLSSCFSHHQLRLIRQAPQLHCMAAADAMAEGSTVGIGGWISASQSFAWFSEQWDMTEVRKHWPQLSKNAQAYIACFEHSAGGEPHAQWLALDNCVWAERIKEAVLDFRKAAWLRVSGPRMAVQVPNIDEMENWETEHP